MTRRVIRIVGFLVLACSWIGCGDGSSGSTVGSPELGAPTPSSGCAALYSCTAQTNATEVRIVNECGGTSNVALSIVGPDCGATVAPTCLQNVGPAGTSVWLQGNNTANNFRVGPSGSSTLFEVTHNASGSDWFDISQNAGFDVGMTVVPPGGAVPYIVCTSENCPGAYPFGSSACETNPCLQPNYDAGPTGGTFELYLCNGWPEDPRPSADHGENTPGPLACAYNQGTCISPTSPNCPSLPQNLACQWGHPVPGQSNPGHGTCPLSCLKGDVG